jgi:solute carrier family 44 protein 1 (choline transporter-like protein)
MAVATFVISALYVFILKWLTKPLLYISMVLILAGFTLLGVFLWMRKAEYLLKDANGNTIPTPEGQSNTNYDVCMYGAIVSWVIGLIYAIVICCCWRNIALGASIMECSSQFVSSNLRIMLLPVTCYLICMPFIAYWCVTALYLFSIGTPEFKPNSFTANVKWEECDAEGNCKDVVR